MRVSQGLALLTLGLIPVESAIASDLPEGAVARLGERSPLRFTDEIHRIARGPGGRVAVAASERVHVLSLREPKRIASFDSGGTDAVAFSPNGKIVAVGALDGAFLVDAATGRVVGRLGAPTRFRSSDLESSRGLGQNMGRLAKLAERMVGRLSFSPDGRSLAVLSRASVEVFDVRAKRKRFAIKGWKRAYDVAFRPDGKSLALLTERGIQEHDPTSGAQRRVLPCEGSRMAYSPDSKRVVMGDTLGLACMDAASGEVVFRVEGMHGAPVGFGFGPGYLAVGFYLNHLAVYSLDTGKRLAERSLGEGLLNTMTTTEDGKTLLAGGVLMTQSDGDLRRFDAKTLEPAGAKPVRGHTGSVEAVVFAGEDQVLTGSADGSVRRWEVRSGKALGVVARLGAGVEAAALSRDGKTLAVAVGAKLVLLDAKTGAEGRSFTCLHEGKQRAIRQLAYAASGEQLVLTHEAWSSRPTHCVWSADGAKLLHAFGRRQSRVRVLEGTVLHAQDGKLMEVAVASGEERSSSPMPGRVLDLSPDGSAAVVRDGRKGTIRCVGRTGEERWRVDLGKVSTVRYGPRARVVACVGAQQVRLLDAKNGEQLESWAVDSRFVTSLAFSPSGRTLCAGLSNDTVLVWALRE